MKLLYLSWRRLRLYAVENRLVSVLFMVSGVISLLAFFILYARFMPHLRIDSQMNSAYRFFQFYFSQESRAYPELERLLDSVPCETIRLSTLPPSGTVRGTEMYFCTYLENESSIEKRLYQPTVREPGELGADGALIGSGGRQDQSGGHILYQGKAYRICGRWGGYETLLSPAAFKRDMAFSLVSFRTRKPLEPAQIRRLAARFSTQFPVARSLTPLEARSRAARETPLTLVLLALFYGAALSSYVFLLGFLADSQRRNNQIYRMVGLSMREAREVAVFDIIQVNLLLAISASVLHALLWPGVFSKINYFGTRGLGPADYFCVIFMTFGISLLVFLPYSLKKTGGTIATHSLED